ncbi:MAG: HDOD domain-containing protein [Desulfobacterales bacterium]|nr:HDOD domain-containing protein [Desulfobacterales bacterium]
MDLNKRMARLNIFIGKMPQLPPTVTKVIEICNDMNSSPTDISRIISLDPVLTGKVLRLINSAYYGLVHEISSIVRAIIMLGMNTVKNLALSTAVLSGLKKSDDSIALDMEDFWRHCLGVGVISKLIASHRGVGQNRLEEYFIAGLLHDIGKIPLNSLFPDEYKEVVALSGKAGRAFYQYEYDAMEIDHSTVGAMIMKSWNLRAEITDTITHHHTLDLYEGEHRGILYTVALANYFTNHLRIGFSGDANPEEIAPEIMDHLGIELDYLEKIEDMVYEEIDKAQVFLNVA